MFIVGQSDPARSWYGTCVTVLSVEDEGACKTLEIMAECSACPQLLPECGPELLSFTVNRRYNLLLLSFTVVGE